jgi:sugar lactone lactonase YvrE
MGNANSMRTSISAKVFFMNLRAVAMLGVFVWILPILTTGNQTSIHAQPAEANGKLAIQSAIDQPGVVTLDHNGNIYISSPNESRIYKVGADKILRVIAGKGVSGFSGDGGPAVAARLNQPYGIAVDAAGNVYIADELNYRVRKVTPAGVISTVAGNGTSGDKGDGGPATAAQFGIPHWLAFDMHDNLYLSENNHLRKITPDGVITTVAGDKQRGFGGDGGPAAFARFGELGGLATDAVGNIYIADVDNHRIRKISANGVINTVAGNGKNGYTHTGPALSVAIERPESVAVDRSGNLYITDSTNGRVRKVAADGTVSTIAGNGRMGYSGDGGPATSARFNGLGGIAVDDEGNVYVADAGNHRIRKVSPAGLIMTIAGNGISGDRGDGGPATSARLMVGGCAVDSAGNLYIADLYRVRMINTAGMISTVAGTGTPGYGGDGGSATAALLFCFDGIAVDAKGNLFIADASNNRVRRVTPDGIITTVAGNGASGKAGDGGPATAAQLEHPQGVAVDAKGNLYIADSNNHRIRKVAPNGIISSIVGGGPGEGREAGDGRPALQGVVISPISVALDAKGNLFIASWFRHRIRKVSLDGIISTVAGDGISGYRGDGGPATSARLASPFGVAVDGSGNLFIADSYNQRIRKVTPNGIINSIAGDGSAGFFGDGGPARLARFQNPTSVAVDGAGNVYVGDMGNRRIRRITPTGVMTTVAGVGPPTSEDIRRER